MNWKFELNRHDIWIGLYWKKGHYYVCGVPCVVLHFWKEGA